jgi:hypothetical protein
MIHILGQLYVFLLIFPNKITKEAGKCGPWGQNLMHKGKQKLVYETLIKIWTKFMHKVNLRLVYQTLIKIQRTENAILEWSRKAMNSELTISSPRFTAGYDASKMLHHFICSSWFTFLQTDAQPGLNLLSPSHSFSKHWDLPTVVVDIISIIDPIFNWNPP